MTELKGTGIKECSLSITSGSKDGSILFITKENSLYAYLAGRST